MYSPKSPENGMLHLMTGFNERAALQYMHTEISLNTLRLHAGDYVGSQPWEVKPLLTERLRFADTISSGYPHPFLYSILGLMILQKQAIIDDVSTQAIERADSVLSNLSFNPGGRIIVAKAAIRFNCQPYYNLMDHVATKHIPPNAPTTKMFVWSGLQQAYIIGNYQKQIKENL